MYSTPFCREYSCTDAFSLPCSRTVMTLLLSLSCLFSVTTQSGKDSRDEKKLHEGCKILYMSFIKCFHVPSFNHVRAHNRSVFKHLSVSIKNLPCGENEWSFYIWNPTALCTAMHAMNSAQNRYCFLLPIMSAMPRPSSLTASE